MRTLTRFGIVFGIVLFACPWPARAEDADDAKVRKSVVKVHSTLHQADPFRPWTKGAPQEATGSGVVIPGKRVLTNAHMVNNASLISIQPDKSSEKLAARVVIKAPGIDLAVLALDDESFFDAHPPLATNSKLPDLKQTVFTFGFPTGGSEMSITRGIISRIEYAEYYLGVEGLRIQVDAAINPGNSGGPAVIDGQLIGLVFSRLQASDNIGYLIPMEEINRFLDDVRDGRYDGKPVLDIDQQKLENSTLRGKFKLDKAITGALVRKVYNRDPSYPLQVGDVITKIGDQAIDNTGMVQVDGGRRISFHYLVQRQAREGRLLLTIVRDGRELKRDVPVQPLGPRLFSSTAEKPLSYFIVGPLSFTEATDDYIRYLAMMYVGGGGDDEGAGGKTNGQGILTIVYQGNPMFARYGDRPAFPGERIVIVPHPIFTHTLSKGYDDPYADAVAAVNGIHVRNLADLVELVRDATGEFLEFTFQGRATYLVVLNREDALKATEEILNDNGIRHCCSPDMAPVWNDGKPKK